MSRKNIYLSILTILLIAFPFNKGISQDIPEKPVPPRLVNDFAGMFTASEAERLEQKLVAFNDSTSTQISIVTVKSLDGYDKADYAQRLAEKWGIGQKGRDNGILILVKPKTADSNGQVQIAQGYGLEGAIPDLTCGEIVDNEILPAFRNGDIYGGLDKATSTLMSLARGEFTAAEYGKKAGKNSKQAPGGAIAVIFIILFIFLISRGGGGGRNRRITTGGLPFWLLMGMLGSGGGSHRGGWGGSSGGFGGGGGGGFGGFGGGSFGGGGAGGSW